VFVGKNADGIWSMAEEEKIEAARRLEKTSRVARDAAGAVHR
jgi:hypothetical protein